MTLRSETDARVARFDTVERALHWVNATLFLTLMATAAVLYIGPLEALVGRRQVVRDIHVWCGLLLPIPLIAALVGPWRRNLRRDIRQFNRWDLDTGKFNRGQKLNAAFTGGVIPVMLATGSIMHWFHPFPNAWRTGATFVHDWVAIALFVTVTGHISIALSDRDALLGMVRGWVPESWARLHRPAWYESTRNG